MKLKPPSDYVTANVDIRTGDVIEFLDEGEYTHPPQNPEREVLTFKVLLANGEEKKISVNKTSQKSLMSAWCPEDMDSKHWVGKRAKVEIIRQQVFDKLKDVIFLTPVEGGQQAPIVGEALPPDPKKIPVVEDDPAPDPEPEG